MFFKVVHKHFNQPRWEIIPSFNCRLTEKYPTMHTQVTAKKCEIFFYVTQCIDL